MDEGWLFSPRVRLSAVESEFKSTLPEDMEKVGMEIGELCLDSNLYISIDLMVVKDEKFEEYVQHEGDVMHGILRGDYTKDLDKYYELEQERREEYFAYLDEEGKPWYDIATGFNNEKGETTDILKLFVNNIKVKERDMNE